MNALEMAQWIEDDNTCDGDEKIAAMLRRQHEAIQKLREALTTCVCAMQDYQAGIGITEMFDKGERLGRFALKDTEGL